MLATSTLKFFTSSNNSNKLKEKCTIFIKGTLEICFKHFLKSFN